MVGEAEWHHCLELSDTKVGRDFHQVLRRNFHFSRLPQRRIRGNEARMRRDENRTLLYIAAAGCEKALEISSQPIGIAKHSDAPKLTIWTETNRGPNVTHCSFALAGEVEDQCIQ